MGLVITGGTTISSGQTVNVASYSFTEPAGTDPIQATALRTSQADARSASLGAGAKLKLKNGGSGGTLLVTIPLNTGASGPFDAAVDGVAALDVSPALSAAAESFGSPLVADYYEFTTSADVVKWSGTTIA